MIGGFQQNQVTEQHQNLVNSQKDHINAKLGTHHAAFHVKSSWSQVVAGTNHFFHLTADGKDYSVCIFEPLPHTQQPPEISLAEVGHTQARHPSS